MDLYELERRNSMRSKAVSVLNLDNGRRDNLREDYEAEMDCISIFKNMYCLIFFFVFYYVEGWGVGRFSVVGGCFCVWL